MENLHIVQSAPGKEMFRPVDQASRISSVDVLRGVALLGILLMNIPEFSMPRRYSEAFRTNPGDVNFWVRAVIIVVFEGKMRALFSMIFGAGILLFTMKKEASGRSVTGLFYQRMGWLILFGLVDAHLLLWEGDILYFYGVIGMIAFLFRKMKAKYLIWGIPLVAITDFVSNTLFYQDMREKRLEYVNVTAKINTTQSLTAAEKTVIADWRDIEQTFIPNQQDIVQHTQTMQSGYNTIAKKVRKESFDFQTKYLVYGIWDPLALMLLGMAFFKWGFFTGKWSKKQYIWTMIAGYGIGLPLVLYDFYYSFVNYPDIPAILAHMEKHPIVWENLIYPFQRILLVMAHASVILLLLRSGVFKAFFKRLASVGQMALTNYVMHTVICTVFFFGYGFGFFAQLVYYQIFYVVLAIWVLQLILSPIWLRHFHFGPLEWLWRSLTYRKIQPMRKVKEDKK